MKNMLAMREFSDESSIAKLILADYTISVVKLIVFLVIRLEQELWDKTFIGINEAHMFICSTNFLVLMLACQL